MLLGRTAGKRLEPVGIVGCPLLHGPLFHAGGHTVGILAAQRRSVVDGIDDGIVGSLGEVFGHGCTAKHMFTEKFRRAFVFRIKNNSFSFKIFIKDLKS